MQAINGTNALGLVGAHAAEANRVRDAGLFERGDERVARALLRGAQVRSTVIRWNHGVNGSGAGKRAGHGFGIVDIADESFRAFLNERIESLFAAADDADFFTFCEQHICENAACMACRSRDDVHDCLSFAALCGAKRRATASEF